MSQRRLDLVFAVLGGAVMLFILSPLVSIVLRATPETLWQAFTDPEVRRAILLTFAAAALATAVGIVGGVPLAYLLARRSFRGKRAVEAVINLPIVIPHTAAGVALLLVYGRSGVVGELLEPIGVTFTDSLAGIVTAMLFVSLPFLINISREAFSLVDRELEQVALADGANPWQAFALVTLPLAWRGVLSGMLMMWARGISEFGAVVILAYHPKTAPVLVFERFEGFGLASALPAAVVLVLAALAAFSLLKILLVSDRGTQ